MTGMHLDSDEQAIHEMALDFFARRVPLDGQMAAARATIFDGAVAEAHLALSREMAELGFYAQAATEAVDGLGMRPLVSGLICEAAGRELAPGVWLDQLISVALLEGLGAAVCGPVLAGERTVSVGVSAGSDVVRLQFAEHTDRWVVLGTDGVGVYEPVAARITPTVAIDPLCPVSEVSLAGLEPEVHLALGGDAVRTLTDRAGLLAASFATGAAARCLEIAVEYVGQRHQFGRPIGSFQAIKHRAANAQIEVQHARSAVMHALTSGAGAPEARVAADRCLRTVAESALQMHGGIGFTAEVPMHLFVRAAQRLRAWPEPVEDTAEAIRRALGIDGDETLVAS